MHPALAQIWEWEWWKPSFSDGSVTFFAVVLLLFGSYGFGFAQGRFPDGKGNLPAWAKLALLAGIIGFGLVIGTQSPPCEPGECGP